MLGDAQIGRNPLQRASGTIAMPAKVAKAADFSAALQRRQSAARSRRAAASPVCRNEERPVSMARTDPSKREGGHGLTLPFGVAQRKYRSPIVLIETSHGRACPRLADAPGTRRGSLATAAPFARPSLELALTPAAALRAPPAARALPARALTATSAGGPGPAPTPA